MTAVPTKINPTELDKEILDKAEAKKNEFLVDMIKYKSIMEEDKTNDYPFFLYIASIMNYVEYHNEGCLSEWGMKSLGIDISRFIHQLQTGEPKLSQKDLVRLLLNLLFSYASSVLTLGLIGFRDEDPVKFQELNKFPTAIEEDFDMLKERLELIIPKLKQVLDTYSPMLEGKYKRVFLEEKTKGFIKPIFDPNALKIKSNTFPSNLENARECK